MGYSWYHMLLNVAMRVISHHRIGEVIMFGVCSYISIVDTASGNSTERNWLRHLFKSIVLEAKSF